MTASVADTADTLLTASRLLVGIAARSLASVEDDVSPVQFRALVVMWEREVCTPGALAEELGVHPSTATRLCDRLVAKRLVHRTAAAASRREVELHLTDSGRRLVDEVIELRRRDLTTVARRLTADERSALIDALASFNAAAVQLGARQTGATAGALVWPT